MRAARCRGANTFVFILHQKSKKLNQRGLPGPRLWPPMPAARPQLPPRSPHSRAVFSHVSSLSWEHRQPGFCAPKNSVSQPSADEAWNRAPFFHLMNRLKKKDDRDRSAFLEKGHSLPASEGPGYQRTGWTAGIYPALRADGQILLGLSH